MGSPFDDDDTEELVDDTGAVSSTAPEAAPSPNASGTAAGGPAARYVAPKNREQLRQILMMDTGIPVSPDDPVLLVYAIHRVSLDELTAVMSALLAEAREAIEAASTKAAAEMTSALQIQTKDLREQITSDTLRERLKAMQETAVLGNEAVAGMRRMVRWGAVITTLTILAAGVVLAVLTVSLS
ncbi:hypothetical protein [Novispirillum itersonii]|uniref:Glutamyl-tRNA reductase n=1 Tax=Novispirillum itersonii TaxID=189 RepID=A0A7W9ZHX6_NOVIT|nr:hypothetical protein [Novispirillum itersonii]MBB6211806.1 glutamyl-tRNA reductase [Novispirillum itersonii]